MLSFTDKKRVLKGIGKAIALDLVTGQCKYYTDKFQTSNVTTEMDMGEVRAGIGNGILTMIPSNVGMSVETDAADWSLDATAIQTGAALTYGAPVITCQTVTASGTSLSISVASGTPVAALGYTDVFCWVQAVGADGSIAQTGTPYPLDPSTGAITGFTAASGTKYKVTYFVTSATARKLAYSTGMNPAAVYFQIEFPVYWTAAGTSSNVGTRAGTLYYVIPRLKPNGTEGGVSGSQTDISTTKLRGVALPMDEDVVSETCDDCAAAGSDLGYAIYVPCDNAGEIQGLVLLGGIVTVKSNGTAVPTFYLVMADGSLVRPDPAFMSYNGANLPSGTEINETTGEITAGATTGSGTIEAEYDDSTVSGGVFDCTATLIVSAS